MSHHKHELQQQYDELSFLCHHYDPYWPDKTSESVNALLKKYHLTHLDDPFVISTELLKMLVQCENAMKKQKEERDASQTSLQ
ncbi:MAG: hypothetical protein OXB88_04595 [Bacteriovoracales bacterium]|nr:hypothetical protein [Bacteriovoracales bacterium]